MGRSRSAHALREAGLHTEELAFGNRGRRYFHVGDSVRDHKTHCFSANAESTDAEVLTFVKDSQERSSDDFRGLSSAELAKIYNAQHRRSRKHILQVSTALDHDYSVASEPISEDSAAFHLGHRDPIKDPRVKALLEQQEQQEKQGLQEKNAGLSSSFLNQKASLGKGKKMYGKEHADCKWVMYRDHSGRVDTWDGDQVKTLQKRRCGLHMDQLDHITDDQLPPEPERHQKRSFHNKVEAAVHATEDIPLGVSTQVDLDTVGFLGKSKGRAECPLQHMSSDPVSHKPDEPRTPGDLSSYGMNNAGRRKFLVQSNLDTGCRHRFRAETQAAPTLCLSKSAPLLPRDLPPNQTPYYQDDLRESERAIKNEVAPGCRVATESNRNMSLRRSADVADNTWLSFPDHKGPVDRMDQTNAESFIGGQDTIRSLRTLNHEQLQDQQFHENLGPTKRNFGNAHNKSDFRFDYADDAKFIPEHVTSDGRTKWGAGHGRKKFNIVDHVSHHHEGADGTKTYTSACGVNLRSKNKIVPPFMDPKNKQNYADTEGFIVGEDGKTGMFRSKSKTIKVTNDSIPDLLVDDIGSETSSTVACSGVRRKTDLIRPQSARRFPQKDFEKAPPRSLTPRPQSSAGVPLHARPGWRK